MAGTSQPSLPLFLQDTSEEARREFLEIVRDQRATKAETRMAVALWAVRYGLADEVDAAVVKQDERRAEAMERVMEAVEALPAAILEVRLHFSTV